MQLQVLHVVEAEDFESEIRTFQREFKGELATMTSVKDILLTLNKTQLISSFSELASIYILFLLCPLPLLVPRDHSRN